jgi:hypothetical protein
MGDLSTDRLFLRFTMLTLYLRELDEEAVFKHSTGNSVEKITDLLVSELLAAKS